MSTYVVSGLDPAQSQHLYGLSDQAIEACGARRLAAGEGDAVPESLLKRHISLRAFDECDMLDAPVVIPGDELDPAIRDFLAGPAIAYLHAHDAGPGCFAALVRRS